MDEFFKLHAAPEFGGTGDSGVVLPPHSLSVSRQPTVGAAVVNAYAHGLEYAEQVLSAGGLGLFLLALILPVLHLFYPLSGLPHMSVIGWIMFPLTVGCLWILYRLDTVGYRYTPVLFNRAAGKVHVFRPEVEFFSLRPLWGGGRFSIETYEWSCVRAQVTRSRVVTGNLAQDNAQLGCIVLQDPETPNVVAEFPIGVSTTALAVQVLLDHWEHIRRFMEHEGPLFQEGEGPHEDWGTQSLVGALFFGQPLLDLGRDAQPAAQADAVTSLMQIVTIVLFPVLACIGLLRWVSYHIKGKPQWPAEILASVGGQVFAGAELRERCKAVPDKANPLATEESRKLEDH